MLGKVCFRNRKQQVRSVKSERVWQVLETVRGPGGQSLFTKGEVNGVGDSWRGPSQGIWILFHGEQFLREFKYWRGRVTRSDFFQRSLWLQHGD